MEQVVVIYSIVVALLAALIIFIVLVNKNVIMKYSNNVIKRVLTKPLVMYSLRRIASAVISFALAIVVTFCLLRIQDKNLLCTKETGWKKFSAEIREMLCERKLDSLGLNDPLIVQILNYFYQIIPFPKKVCIAHTTTSTFEYICSNSQMMIVNFGRTTELGKNESIAAIFNRTMPVSMKIGLGGLAIEMIIG